MATLAKRPCPGNWEYPAGGEETADAYFTRTEGMIQDLLERSRKIDPEAADLTGALVSFPRGDGKAVYAVTKMKPLTLAHVPYGDAWTIDAAHLRGLRVDDIRKHLRFGRLWGNRKDRKSVV